MVSAETLLNYAHWKINFTTHTHDYDKQLGFVISNNNKPIELLSSRLSKPQNNYTTTEKELLLKVDGLNQFRGIIIGYEINIFQIIIIWSMLQT